jgi:hypothetical protein
MRSPFRIGVAVATLAALSTLGSQAISGAATKLPLSVVHVQRYHGGLSGSVRAVLSGAAEARAARPARSAARPSRFPGTLHNKQMNSDSTPPCRRTRPASRTPRTTRTSRSPAPMTTCQAASP